MIEVRSVSKSYAGRRVVDRADLVVRDGQVTGFVGPNGAGKSTVLGMIAGVRHPDEGEVVIDGAALATSARPASTLGAMLSAELIPEATTAGAHLAYVADTQGLRGADLDDVLARVGLAGARAARVRDLSLGMRQRLGVATALLGDPRNLVLDEPLNGLDPDGIQWMRWLLRDAAARGCAVLLSSHLMSELALVADQIAVILDGRIVRQGALGEFTESLEPDVYVESSDLPALLSAFAAAGLPARPHEQGALVRCADAAHVGRVGFSTPTGLTHLSVVRRSLEQSYFDAVAHPRPEESSIR